MAAHPSELWVARTVPVSPAEDEVLAPKQSCAVLEGESGVGLCKVTVSVCRNRISDRLCHDGSGEGWGGSGKPEGPAARSARGRM